MFFKLFNDIEINNTIKVVCHSGIMKNYFKKKNGSSNRIKDLKNTNVWSFKETIDNNTFMVTRHAFSVANIFKEKGRMTNQISEKDSSLSCYGILSSLLKANNINNNIKKNPLLMSNAQVIPLINNTSNSTNKIINQDIQENKKKINNGSVIRILKSNNVIRMLNKNNNKNLAPETIYVSVLIRTWMTAICLYLPFCKRDKLILEVSQNLKEIE